MSIVNRTLDASEQRRVVQQGLPATALTTGVTSVLCCVPFPCVLDEAQIAMNGLSGSPTYQLNIDRFITGTGFTTIIVATGSSNTPSSYGTSGPGSFGSSLFGASGMILAASGSTLLNLLPNDLVLLTTGGANSAAKSGAIALVLRPIQDIKVHFGLV